MRVLIEHVDRICSLESGLSFGFICSFGNLDIFEVMINMLNPEQEYSTDVDWWALGVIIYETLMGLTPFYAETVEEVFANICKGEIEFLPEDEDDYMDEASRAIVTALLDQDRSSRLSTPEDIKEHAYFAGIEWDNILRQKVLL